ncbi:MAG: prepilin peptidase [Lachnospiraceae bacterium]|nr:prepilin peptidase [Lachnospiraceae bacterium]
MEYYVAAILFLGVCTVMDLRKRQIWWPFAVLFLTVVTAFHFVRADMDCVSLLGGIGIGLGMLLLSWATREAIGYGDGLVVAACGAALGFVKTMGVITAALCFAAVWSGILLILKKAGRGDSFPFLPFLLVAEVCGVILL